jgi:transposase
MRNPANSLACISCGKKFYGKSPNQKYCSKSCYHRSTKICKEIECVSCGKKIEKGKQNKKYCSRQCYFDSRFGKELSDGKIKSRNLLCLKAVKLCQSGLSQKEACERVGIEIYILRNYFTKLGAKKTAELFKGRTCQYCQKSLDGMVFLSSRKYCSLECNRKALYEQKYPNRTHKTYEMEIRTQALGMYFMGLSQKEISEKLGIPEGTIACWVLRYNKRN